MCDPELSKFIQEHIYMDDTPTPTPGTQPSSIRGLLHGLTYQTPVIGTIRIGSVEEKNGKSLPVRDDHFTVWTRFRDHNGDWVKHAVMEELEKDPVNHINEKLRRIPVRVIYDTPNLNMGEQYAAFTRNGRPACVGNGDKAKQAGLNSTISEVACPGPDLCVFGRDKEHRCDTLTRAIFHIEGQDASEGAFILRTGSYNSVNDMRVRLESLYAGFGKKLSGLPMWLTMRLKSSAQSYNKPFFYVSLEPRFASFKEGLAAINERSGDETSAGFDRPAYEAAIAALLANGSFTENSEDLPEFEDLLAGRNQDETDGKPARAAVTTPDLSDLTGVYAKKATNDVMLPDTSAAAVGAA
jgi:hypothetical protein